MSPISITYIKEGKCCVEGENPGPNPWYRAETQKWPVQSGLSGGATGTVKIPSGDSPEGVGVQLIAPNGVRTTVYTDAKGHYEFPKMQTGDYVLRVPTPLLFKPYVINSVHIDGATKLDDIVLGESFRQRCAAGHSGDRAPAQRRRIALEHAGHGAGEGDAAKELLRLPFLEPDFPQPL